MSTVTATKPIAFVEEDATLQFARQLYDRSLELHGTNHECTLAVLEYITELESRDSRP